MKPNNKPQKSTVNPEDINIRALQEKLAEHELELRIGFDTLTKKEKDVLMKTVKLQEEVGELANDILSVLSLQRKSKLAQFKKANLYEEFADIVLATFALANTMGVKMDLAVKNKLNKVLTQYSKDK
jgi:NTP pyrophosphatase (non-canonical NTP hydrolase)